MFNYSQFSEIRGPRIYLRKLKSSDLFEASSMLYSSNTWVVAQRGVMKLLMLDYSFETIKVKRVEFAVDPENTKSNIAMKRVGATHEGMLRKWRPNATNDVGHRNIYSVIDDDWPGVKENLLELLNRRYDL